MWKTYYYNYTLIVTTHIINTHNHPQYCVSVSCHLTLNFISLSLIDIYLFFTSLPAVSTICSILSFLFIMKLGKGGWEKVSTQIQRKFQGLCLTTRNQYLSWQGKLGFNNILISLYWNPDGSVMSGARSLIILRLTDPTIWNIEYRNLNPWTHGFKHRLE